MGFSRQEYWSGVPLPSPLSYIGECISELTFLFLCLLMSSYKKGTMLFYYYGLKVYLNIY